MSFPWKSTLTGAALLAGTVYVVAAQLAPGPNGPMNHPMQPGAMHGQPTQGGTHGSGMHHTMQGGLHGRNSSAAGVPLMPGQDAFGTIQEIVQILEADPATDWSKVDIAALREHLIGMNEVTLKAKAGVRMLSDGIVIDVTGEGRTLAAIKRMVPAHIRQLAADGWDARTDDRPDGVTLTVKTQDTRQRARLKGLGFIGIMAQGAHHQVHHLMMAKGEFPH